MSAMKHALLLRATISTVLSSSTSPIKVTGGETTVGNFHLLPISHAPQGAEPSLCAVGSNREGTGVRDFGHGQEPILASGNGGGVDRNDQPCAWECGDGRGWAPSCPYSGGCFVSGAATGVLLYLLLTWLVTVRGYGKTSWERWCNWLKVGNEWREAAIGEERGGKVGAQGEPLGRSARPKPLPSINP